MTKDFAIYDTITKQFLKVFFEFPIQAIIYHERKLNSSTRFVVIDTRKAKLKDINIVKNEKEKVMKNVIDDYNI